MYSPCVPTKVVQIAASVVSRYVVGDVEPRVPPHVLDAVDQFSRLPLKQQFRGHFG